jgi:hypothetical protein
MGVAILFRMVGIREIQIHGSRTKMCRITDTQIDLHRAQTTMSSPKWIVALGHVITSDATTRR